MSLLTNLSVASCGAFSVVQNGGEDDAGSSRFDAGVVCSDASTVAVLGAACATDGGAVDAPEPTCSDLGVVCDDFERELVAGVGVPWSAAQTGATGSRVATTIASPPAGYRSPRSGEFYVPGADSGASKSFARVVFSPTSSSTTSRVYMRERLWINALPIGEETLQTLTVESPTDTGGGNSFVIVSIDPGKTTLSQAFDTASAAPTLVGPAFSVKKWVLVELTVDFVAKTAVLSLDGVKVGAPALMSLTRTLPGKISVLTGIYFYGPSDKHTASQVLVDDVLIQTLP
jgi:hypothetical protein